MSDEGDKKSDLHSDSLNEAKEADFKQAESKALHEQEVLLPILSEIYLSQTEKEAAEQGDSKAVDEETRLRIEKLECEIELARQNTKERKRYAQWTFWYLVGWTFNVLWLLFWNGIGWIDLPESTLNFLITASTAKVIGLFAIVMWNLFPSNKQDS